MNYILIIMLVLIFSSCRNEQKSENMDRKEIFVAEKIKTKTSKNLDFKDINNTECQSEAELKKKLESEIKKAKEHNNIKLQGNNTGCQIE